MESIEKAKRAYNAYLDDFKGEIALEKSLYYSRRKYDLVIHCSRMCRNFLSIGLSSISKEYALKGVKVLEDINSKGIKKQSKLLKIEEFESSAYDNLANYYFNLALNENLIDANLTKTLHEFKQVYEIHKQKKAFRKAKVYKYIIINLAIQLSEHKLALVFLKDINKSIKFDKQSKRDIVLNNTVLDQRVLFDIEQNKLNQSSYSEYFKLFFETLHVDDNGSNVQTRALDVLYNTAYLYYKFIKKDCYKVDPILVWQSTHWGDINKRIEESQILRKIGL